MVLFVLMLIPFIFGLLSWQSERVDLWIPKWVALFGLITVFIIVLFLWLLRMEEFQLILPKLLSINKSDKWQLEYISNWIPRFGISLHLALDGLSLLMLMLSGIVGIIAILASWNEKYSSPGLFYFNLLWVFGGVIGVFLSIDMFLLFFFWEIMLIPMYFLISLWGYRGLNAKSRVSSAIRFFIHTQCSGLIILVSILILASFYHNINGVWSFNYEDLLNVVLPSHVEYLLMLGFFIAFAIKMPIVPFHTWLPETHSYSPTAGSVDLIGILLKTAVYGFFRFTLPLFPCASQNFAPIAMSFGILSIFYGSWIAVFQTDIKRFIAYTNVSHMGFILIAIYSNNQLSYQGAVVQMIAYSLSSSGMFILCGQLYDRLRTQKMSAMGGLWGSINLLPAFALCFIAAMLGIPGTGNFIGEIIILFGTFQTMPTVAILATFGILFTSIHSLILMQRVYYGSALEFSCPLKKIVLREKFILAILLLCLFVIGLFPQFILNTSYKTTQNIYIRLQECNNGK